jgi:hypothetical protein
VISICSKTISDKTSNLTALDTVIKVHENIEVVAEIWQSIVPEGHPLEYQRLLAIQHSLHNQFNFYYITIEDEHKQLIGVQYFQYLPFRAAYFDSVLKRNVLLRNLEKYVVGERFRMLICGSLFSVNAPGYYFANEQYDPIKKGELLKKGAAEIMRISKKCELIFKDVDSILENYFNKSEFHAFNDDVTMTMPIRSEWNSLNDYIASLKHKYAQRARKILKAATVLERINLSADQIHSQSTVINTLFNQVVQKQNIRLGIPDAGYFYEMKRHKPDSFQFYGYFLENSMVAFSTYFIQHHSNELHYIGVDYELNKKHYLYFNILFDGISRAIDHKTACLELGRTAREAKAVVGAEPVAFKSYISFSSSLSKWIYTKLKARFQHTTELNLKDRHPFKNS